MSYYSRKHPGWYNTGRYAAKGLYGIGRGVGYVARNPGQFAAAGAAYAVGPSKSGAAAPIRNRARRSPRSAKRCKALNKKEVSKQICHIKKSLKTMKQHDDATTGTLTYRDLVSSRLLSAENRQNVISLDGSAVDDIELSLANLKFFDPSTPGTLITANGSTGTYQRNYLFDSISSKIVVRNNYQSDASVKIYLCKPKDDTSQSPYDAWGSGLADGGNADAITALNQYPTDYDLLNDLWSLKVVSNSVLSPGQTISCSNTESGVEYDPSIVDTHSLDYQKEYKAFTWLVVLMGTLGHDVSLDDQSIMQAGLDILVYKTLKVKYAAGVNIKYIHLAQTLDVTANPVQSHQPVPNNVPYSVA